MTESLAASPATGTNRGSARTSRSASAPSNAVMDGLTATMVLMSENASQPAATNLS